MHFTKHHFAGAALCFCVLSFISSASIAQTDSVQVKVMAAGKEYKTSAFHQWLWGKNYRKVWATPVALPVFMIDTAKGGLTPVKLGGGNQTSSLHLQTRAQKQYTLRSVNKKLGKVIPKIFHGTFIEEIVNDKVSMSNPYGAAVVPTLADAAKIYHANPGYVYLPDQKAIDTLEKKLGKEVYLFEQKIDGNWQEADNLGNFSDFIGTDKLLDKIYESNKVRVDQKLYVRSRLFDMLINDWDRHEDQWEWGMKEIDGIKTYSSVPQDRDQAFSTHDGVLLTAAFKASGIKYMQTFNPTIADVTNLNFEQRNLDRFFANRLDLKDWREIATSLQQSITDRVIDEAVKNLPAEVYPVAGAMIAAKLKSRRNDLIKFATTYYKFIAKEVDVIGSKDAEVFDVEVSNDQVVTLKISDVNKEGNVKSPMYSRNFTAAETKELRIYGLSGNDVFTVHGNNASPIKIRIIGGDEKDSISVEGNTKVHVYDNKKNAFAVNSNIRLHFSNDSSVHAFQYKSYVYDKKGISPTIFFTNEDRFFVGLGYGVTTHKWRKEPFASRHRLQGNYSLSQKAFSVIYNGLYPKLVGKWDVALNGVYDQVRWTNFFGFGNETKFVEKINYYRARTEEWNGTVSLLRKFGRSHISIGGGYQSSRILNDSDRITGKHILAINPAAIGAKQFAIGKIGYKVHRVNDSIIPTKGYAFFANALFTHNLKQTTRSTAKFGGQLQLYIPLAGNFSIASRTGGETVSGDPEFYQYASIGGGQILRGFRQNRFWGETAFYTSNEIRFITNARSYLYNGKIGLLAFYDNGRVWMKNENSNTWHNGYGGGIILAPFNALLASVTYAISKDENLIQLRISQAF